jgi:hypothetical protein
VNPRRPYGIGDDDDGLAGFMGGSATTMNSDGKRRRTREFPPGFHGANPGPSYDEDPPRAPRAKPTQAKGRKR